ncbi:MAG: DNA methyltransferase, partial [Candidatus Omnitrophota bacterium]|nr:DNA methyltransferase [Candidatus Omnitrophota bacterium]
TRKFFSANHDYIFVYAKDIQKLKLKLLPRIDERDKSYKNSDNDPRGPWTAGGIDVGPLVPEQVYPIFNPFTKQKIYPPKGYCWRFKENKLKELIKDNRIYFPKSGRGVPRIKRFLREVKEGIVPMTIWEWRDVGHNQEAKQELKQIFKGESLFESPKPARLIKRLIQLATENNDLILDSFAGSGTTGQAVLELNKEDGGNRKFILVEMEKDICRNITAERIRRVAKGYSYKNNGGEVVKVQGLGGGFEYVELGDTLFNSEGSINEAVSFTDMASYVFFTETHTNLDKHKIKGNYIGGFSQTHYFLLFDGIGKNILDRRFLKELKAKEGKKIVYADKCLLDEEALDKYQIIFKQIPYQVKVY